MWAAGTLTGARENARGRCMLKFSSEGIQDECGRSKVHLPRRTHSPPTGHEQDVVFSPLVRAFCAIGAFLPLVRGVLQIGTPNSLLPTAQTAAPRTTANQNYPPPTAIKKAPPHTTDTPLKHPPRQQQKQHKPPPLARQQQKKHAGVLGGCCLFAIAMKVWHIDRDGPKTLDCTFFQCPRA